MKVMQQISLKYKALLTGFVALSVVVLGQFCVRPAIAEFETLGKKDASTYKLAFKAAKAGNWKKARNLAAHAKHPLPAKVLSWLQYTSPASSAGFSEINSFLNANPGWPRRRTLRRRAEEAIKNELSDDEAIAWFAADAPLTAAGATRYGLALLAKGRQSDATAFVRMTWRDLNMGRADERSFRRHFRKLLRKEDHIARLDSLIWDQRIGSARRQIRLVGRDYQHLGLARLQLMQRAGGVDGAIARVPAALQQHPGLIYERLRWRRRKGLTDRAIDLLRDPPAQLSRPSKWWLERAILSRRALRNGEISLAYRLAPDHKQTDGATYAEAEWLSGWIALRYLHDYDIAFQHFRRLYKNVRYPVSRARGAYWTARAIEARPTDVVKRKEEARIWYRAAARYTTTFYGQLAVDRLRQQQSTQPPEEPNPAARRAEKFESRELVRVTRLLAMLKQDKLVKTFVRQLAVATKHPAEWALLARLTTDLGRNDLAIKVAKLAIRQGIVLSVRPGTL